jgi:hypothetical protein
LQTTTDPVDNLQHLLRLPNFDKTRLDAFHLQYNKGNYNDWLFQKEKTLSVYDMIYCSPLPMTIIAKHLLQTDDAKRQCLMLLCESISLSQLYIFCHLSVLEAGIKPMLL